MTLSPSTEQREALAARLEKWLARVRPHPNWELPMSQADVEIAIAALRAIPREVSPRQRAFWVIERFENGASAGYWNGGSSRSFVPNINEAVQFCRREDAFWATRGWHWNDTQIVEHMMIG